jgi:hypothetical protein
VASVINCDYSDKTGLVENIIIPVLIIKNCPNSHLNLISYRESHFTHLVFKLLISLTVYIYICNACILAHVLMYLMTICQLLRSCSNG